MLEFHSETVDLPSKGWLYPKSSPLSSGHIDLYPMTAKHEDILTSANLIEKGTVIQKLLESLIATKDIRVQDLLVSDRESLVVAARIMAYGKEYKPRVFCESCAGYHEVKINLEDLKDKESPLFTEEQKHNPQMFFELPQSKVTIGFRLLTVGDEMAIQADLDGYKKLKKDVEPRVITSLRYIITSINGDVDKSAINKFVDMIPIKDSRALKEHYAEISPGLDTEATFICTNCDSEGSVDIPMQSEFFWPKL